MLYVREVDVAKLAARERTSEWMSRHKFGDVHTLVWTRKTEKQLAEVVELTAQLYPQLGWSAVRTKKRSKSGCHWSTEALASAREHKELAWREGALSTEQLKRTVRGFAHLLYFCDEQIDQQAALRRSFNYEPAGDQLDESDDDDDDEPQEPSPRALRRA